MKEGFYKKGDYNEQTEWQGHDNSHEYLSSVHDKV